MKYKDKVSVLIPWYDTDGFKQYTIVTLQGETIDRRYIYKTVRRYCKMNFGKVVPKQWIKEVVKIVHKDDFTPEQIKAAEKNLQKAVDVWLDKLEKEADALDGNNEEVNSSTNESSTNTSSETSSVEGAEVPLRIVQDRPIESTE